MAEEKEQHHHEEHHDQHHEHHEHGELFIHIDHKKYHPPKHEMTGKELRLLAEPHIGEDYNLWLETPGPGDDELIEDEKHVHLHRGMSFYSVLKQINPGACNAVA